MPARKLMPRDDAIRDGFSTYENLPHGQIVAVGTDMSAKLYSSRESASDRLLEYSFGESG
ncbi:MAG: hypothetical protein QOI29_5391 [Mycobacterium sp.]|jgi:hypothetical protein|nr:hypothetical protein [Mycobacterium sp.]